MDTPSRLTAEALDAHCGCQVRLHLRRPRPPPSVQHLLWWRGKLAGVESWLTTANTKCMKNRGQVLRLVSLFTVDLTRRVWYSSAWFHQIPEIRGEGREAAHANIVREVPYPIGIKQY